MKSPKYIKKSFLKIMDFYNNKGLKNSIVQQIISKIIKI